MVVGQGIDGTTPADLILPQQGRIAWRKIRDEKDDLGVRHVFYQQRFFPIGRIASLVEAKYITEGIEITGSEIGVHVVGAVAHSAFGYQVRNLTLFNEPAIGTALQAYEVAQDVVSRATTFSPADRSRWSVGLVTTQIAHVRLVLTPAGKPAGFRFAWAVPTMDAAGDPFEVVIDAGDASLVRVTTTILGSEPPCIPMGSSVGATAVPQNPSGSRGRVSASIGSKHDGFSHEGARAFGDGQIPEIHTFVGTYDSQWHCLPDFSWAVVPLQTSGGVPTYDNWTNPIAVPGRAAGDAMWFTYLTMQAFASLGRYSWNGGGGVARIIVDPTASGSPSFITDAQATYAPCNGVCIPSDANLRYSFASCLDIVAHEWGHGVIVTSANFDRSQAVGQQLHEGFADVIGYAVEQLKQPTGSGAETRDWTIGEDNWDGSGQRTIKRRVDSDNGQCSSFLPGSMAFHKDACPANTNIYVRANVLPVAYRLLSLGGRNPVSGVDPCPGCTTTVTALGISKAANILFRTVSHYCPSTTQWTDLKSLAIDCAYMTYSRCNCANPYSATTEQQAVDQAFSAIGYTDPEPYWTCPCP